MQINDFKFKTVLKATVLVAAILLLSTGASFGQQVVNLTAGPAGITMSDGVGVPMWGYSCGAAVAATATTATAVSGTTVTVAGPLPVNAYVGTTLTAGSVQGVVTSNTATTLTVASWFPANSTAFSVTATTTGAAFTSASATTTYTATTATDTSLALTPNAYVGATITVGTATATVASNTATTLTLSAWSAPAPAAGTTTISIAASTASCAALNPFSAGGLVGAVAVVNGGSGYTTAPTVTLSAPTGTNTPVTATAVAEIQNGQVVSISVTNPGHGYLTAPTVSITGTATTPATATAGLWWSPVVVTVPTGQTLSINLTNNLYSSLLTGTGTTPVNPLPTSIMIVGQIGGGLGGAPTSTQSPDHSLAQGCVTWFIASIPPGTPCTSANATSSAVPPVQGPRIQSFGTEIAAALSGGTTTPTTLTWSALRPGTYLLESATHPSIQVPMGLIGMLVVTCPVGATTCSAANPSTTLGTAYPGAVATATTAAIPPVTYSAEVPLESSEIDPVQNTSVNAAVNTSGFSETMVWDGHPNGCGNPSSTTYHQCYPPAVNYTPFYYLINGVAFNKTNVMASVFPTTPATPAAGTTTLVRLVNAGLRMHIPSIVGSLTTGYNGAGAAATESGFTLIAEDGNPVPGVFAPGAATAPAAPRVQTHVFMAAGKTFDIMFNSIATGGADLPIYDRALSLSGNSSERDAGMLAYIGVTGSTLPVAAGTGVFSGAQANPDTYNSLAAGQTFSVTDVSKGVIANDVNVYGVTLVTPATSGVVTLNANGTFTYVPNTGSTATSDSFGYCANGAAAGTAVLCTTVSLGASALAGNPSAINHTYTAETATYLKLPSPGLLLGNSDPNNLPLTVVTTASTAPSGGTLVVDANGGFMLSMPGNTAAGTATFPYTVQNSQGRTASGTVTVNFPAPSNLQVRVVDALAYNNCTSGANPIAASSGISSCITGLTPITDYRWIIEEDQTFWVDPNCTTNTSLSIPGCPKVVGPTGQSTIPLFATNFHTSAMPYVAQGCTGPLSCEGGQTMFDNRPACTAPGVPVGCSTTAGAHIAAVCDVGNGACRPDPNAGTAAAGSTQVLPSSVHLDPTKRYYISVLPGDAGNPFPSYTQAPGCNPMTGAQTATNNCGHTQSGAAIPPACNILVAGCTSASTTPFAPVTVASLPTPLPTGKLSGIVFEDDFPLNGEQDAGGGSSVVAPVEPGLGGFNIVLWDTYGGLGDVTGQDTYDMFNMPLSNSLSGVIDPVTGLDACPISAQATADPTQAGITGMIVTCPKYESDNQTLSPLAGQFVVANLMPEKFSVQAYPGADRISRGEEWLQTNTLDGQHPHDSFIRIGEPGYFQEYGPAGYHVAIGFVNPAIINARHDAVCAGAIGAVGACTGTVKGQADLQRMSRTPDQRLYPSGSRDGFAWTQCWVSLGDPDGEDFMFTKCDANGNFQFTKVPAGNWRLTFGDQWNDQIIDGLSTPANVTAGQTLNVGNIGVQQWQANIYTRTFIDDNKNGIFDPGEIGIPLIYTRVRYRDGHNSSGLTTDFNGVANFNETFPLFNWYVVEADSGRYKTTGIHTVYDAGGPADGSTYCGPANGARSCGTSTAYNFLANTHEAVPLPADLSVPGAVYCAAADCTAEAAGFAAGTAKPSFAGASTGRIDPPWVTSEGASLLTSMGAWIDFGKAPYAACNPSQPVSATNFCATVTTTAPGSTTSTTTKVGENGGINGFVNYAATRPFDSAEQMIQQPWEPWVPHVTINLYQEGFAADGVTPTLTLVDTTKSSSWDDWAQGFYPNSTATAGTGQTAAQKPYMSCPGQGQATGANADLFFYSLFDQPNYLDYYNSVHNGGTLHSLPYNSQFKCYDAMRSWSQLQPAVVDGRYSFPSSLGVNPTTGKPLPTFGCVGNAPGTACPAASGNGVTVSNMPGTNCTVCVPNPDSTDHYRFGTPMLPPGKYVVQVIMPPGFEVYKEEDKNLLIGDNFIAPAVQQFGGLGGDIFIIPDQASVASLYDPNANGYNPTNYQNATTGLSLQGGMLSGVPGYPGFQDPVWPCVGEMRVVPDFLSLFPNVQETAPFAGATRPLCDRKEVTLPDQMSVSVKFAIFTSTHIASKFTGVITDDFTSEFDPFAPQFGEKFGPPSQPVSTRDYLGNEISRVYSDPFGNYNGLTYSSWEVNPPNITGYSPVMMVQCMNDAGPILDNRQTIVNSAGATVTNPTLGQLINDPLFNPAYSNFCYENPFMPGLTTYNDTPVVPTQAFVGAGYNNVDCSYPDTTPAIAEVDGDAIGPYVSAAGHKLTITALGDQMVNNYGYGGPATTVAPFNATKVQHHYGFGASAGSVYLVGGDGVQHPLTGVSWSDTVITGNVPAGLPACTIQQQTQYGGSAAQCGQLFIVAAPPAGSPAGTIGKQSVDTVTVTVGGKAPTHVAASQTIQNAIDAALPGDLLIVDPTCKTGTGAATQLVACTTTGATKTSASHTEMIIMWKPVRLQGVGAATSIINANAQPAGKYLSPWRRHLNCFFGLTLDGAPIDATHPYDPNGTFNCPETGWNHFFGQSNSPQIDRLPTEATVGWIASLNGNLAELLQEPSLMGAYEGAGITVLAKGVEFHGQNPFTDNSENGAFPIGTTLLTGVVSHPELTSTTANAAGVAPNGGLVMGDANPLCHTVSYSTTGAATITNTANPYPSNFLCNPSRIDGLTVTNSSQGGGGIFVHAWAHFLEIANNRVYNNAGTLSGGISVGQGEFPIPVIQGSTTNSAPGSCSDGTGFVANQHLPYCAQMHTSVHNNFVTNNSSLGDELFSATLSGAGGVSFCTGNDYYKFNYNWVCGNLSAGEGGGVTHLGEIQNGDIEHNSIVFNQSLNPTIPTNGGGIIVMGTPDTDPVCPGTPDTDCPPGLSDGIGHNLLINANLIQGNSADSGSGGGIRLQQVNGTEVSTFPGVYAITAANAGRTVTITTNAPAATLPAVGDSVTIAGVSVAGYNGTFTVTRVGAGRFFYFDATAGLGPGTGGTFTDTTKAGTAQTITAATETGATTVTITSTASPTVGDRVVISGVTPAGYNGTFTVTCTQFSVTSTTCPGGATSAGTFTYTGPTGLAATGTGGTVVDNNQSSTALWNRVDIINNIIVNNMAGWDGAGISLQDSLNVNIINNTIAHNDTLASSGVLTNSIGAPQASAPPGNCTMAGPTGANTASCPQSAGLTSTPNSSLLTAAMSGLTVTCPTGHTGCTGFSNPILYNDIFWQNRSFRIGISGAGTGTLNQQNLVSLFPTLTQTATGQCAAGASYWDIGVRGDTGPTNHGSGFTLAPIWSLITGYGGQGNIGGDPLVVTQYCNGSRVPPECTVADGCGGLHGFGVPPGIADAVTPNPLFSLVPSATVDEGNNWINVSWGPLSFTNPAVNSGTGSTGTGNWGSGPLLGNYSLQGTSPAVSHIPCPGNARPCVPPGFASGVTTPLTDFYGNPRPDGNGAFDIGAVELPNH